MEEQEKQCVSWETAKRLYAMGFVEETKWAWCLDENACYALCQTEEARDGIPGIECWLPAPTADELAEALMRHMS